MGLQGLEVGHQRGLLGRRSRVNAHAQRARSERVGAGDARAEGDVRDVSSVVD